MSVSVRSSSLATNLAGGTAISIAAPAGTTTGDVVIVIASVNGQTQTIADNNGATPFTEDLAELTQVSMTVSIFSRRIVGGDPSTYNFTIGASQRWTAVAVAFQNPNASNIYDVVAAYNLNGSTLVTTVDAPSITTLTADALHCAVCVVDGITQTISGTPAGYTVQQNGGDQVVAFCTKTIASPSATGAQTFTHSAQTSLAISFAIKSIPPPPPTVIRGTPRIEANLSGVWTSLGRDVLAAEGIRTKRGMVANGPLDVVAVSGTLEFALRNDAQNTGSLQGYYSPNHVNCRSGWTFGIPVRLLVTYNAVDYPIWRGRIRTIEPTPGRYLEQRVSVIAQDCMGDLVDTEVRSITPQISQTEVQLLQATIAAMPTDAQPPATSYDTALDTVPVAFDDIEGGAPAMQLVTDVVKSARGKAYAKNDGTFRYTNRQTIGATVSIGAFTDATLHAEDGISVPSSLANVFNRVRVTIHPKTIDAAATTVLFALPVASAATPSTTLVPSGATAFTIWGNYFDPGNTEKPIGGTAQVTPIVVTTDYKAWSLADGTGSDLTANLTITTTAFASSVKFEIANSGAAAYVTKLQIRGKGIYDNTPITSESYTAKTYGDRLLPVDLKYQNSASIAQEFADRWKTLYADLANQAEYLRFNPQASDTVMLHALQREIADVVTVSETMTGLDTVDLAIHGVEFDITEGTSGAWMLCRWKLAPNLTSAQWILSDTTFSVLGTTTILGLA